MGKTSYRQWLSAFGVALCVSLWAVGCDDSVAGDDDEDGIVTNECGTYDPDNDMHALGPIDPTEPGLVASCESLCDRFAMVAGCTVEADACVDECRLTQCHACPGSIKSLNLCKAKYFDDAGCTCSDGAVTCPLPPECEEESFDTGACGG